MVTARRTEPGHTKMCDRTRSVVRKIVREIVRNVRTQSKIRASRAHSSSGGANRASVAAGLASRIRKKRVLFCFVFAVSSWFFRQVHQKRVTPRPSVTSTNSFRWRWRQVYRPIGTVSVGKQTSHRKHKNNNTSVAQILPGARDTKNTFACSCR